MTYRIATIPTFDRETMAEGETFMRRNDGSLVIRPDDDESDLRLVVPRVAEVKRSDPYNKADPEQEAFAARVVGLLNLFEGLTPKDVEVLEDAIQVAYEDDTAPIFGAADGEESVQRVEDLVRSLKVMLASNAGES